MTSHLRVALWNTFQAPLFASRQHAWDWRSSLTAIYEYQHWLVHTLSSSEGVETGRLQKWFFDAALPWYEVYNFVELVASLIAKRVVTPSQLYQLLPSA
jgi:hypothetical protein